MSKHTPGPWAVHRDRAYVVPAAHLYRPIGGASDDAYDLARYAQEICAMHHPDPHRSEAEVRANARLIAAVPDLLEQALRLRQAIAQLKSGAWTRLDVIAMQDELDAAIAKATGSGE